MARQTGAAIVSCLHLAAGRIGGLSEVASFNVRTALELQDLGVTAGLGEGGDEGAQGAGELGQGREDATSPPPRASATMAARWGGRGATLRIRGAGDAAAPPPPPPSERQEGGGGGQEEDGRNTPPAPEPPHRYEPGEATPDWDELVDQTVGALVGGAVQLYRDGEHDLPNMYTRAGNLRALDTANGVYARAHKFLIRETEPGRVRARRWQVARAQDMLIIATGRHGAAAVEQQMIYILTGQELANDDAGEGLEVRGRRRGREAHMAHTLHARSRDHPRPPLPHPAQASRPTSPATRGHSALPLPPPSHAHACARAHAHARRTARDGRPRQTQGAGGGTTTRSAN